MKKILIIYGHPLKDTFAESLRDSYMKGAKESGAEVKIINLYELNFEINLSQGYRKDIELEEDLKSAQEMIKWCDHMLMIWPNWWSTYPALFKGFIDRTFLPGFAFNYRKGSLLWDKNLKGRSARLIMTMDTPVWYYYLVYRAPGINSIKKGVLHFCGIKPVKSTLLGPIKQSTDEKRKSWNTKVYNLGLKQI